MKKEVVNRGAPDGNTNACKTGKFSTSESNHCGGVAPIDDELDEEELAIEKALQGNIEALSQDYKEALEGDVGIIDDWVDLKMEELESEGYSEEKALAYLWDEYLADQGEYSSKPGPLGMLQSWYESGGDSLVPMLEETLPKDAQQKIWNEVYGKAYKELGERLKHAEAAYDKYYESWKDIDEWDFDGEEDEDE